MKTPVSHQLSMTVLMTPDMANFSGNVHGGHILKLLDQVAYAWASRYAKGYVVTLSVDQVVFRQPIHVGELVTFLASINYTGTTSMEVGIKVVTENIQSQVVRHANSCFFTMVAVNDDGAVLPPCGRCRELIYQIDPANLDTDVIVERGEVVKLRDLLPHPWQPKHWPG